MLTSICLSYFNSTLVRLKAQTSPLATSVVAYFNSTLVRLKEGLEKGITAAYRFQFHFGTIKRETPNTDKRIAILISIPLWYD